MKKLGITLIVIFVLMVLFYLLVLMPEKYEEKDLAIHFNDDELDDDDWLNSIG